MIRKKDLLNKLNSLEDKVNYHINRPTYDYSKAIDDLQNKFKKLEQLVLPLAQEKVERELRNFNNGLKEVLSNLFKEKKPIKTSVAKKENKKSTKNKKEGKLIWDL
ncbi:MAG: hypothetical protein EOL97_09825 [Spirochaetia bacterium]|nr:hypothetical protein [Spirochaetia bacterium]